MRRWPWQKVGVVGAATVVFLALLILLMGRSQRSEISAKPAAPWNSRAVEGAYAGVRVREIDASSAAVVFLYDLDNQSGSDYELTKGPGVVVMSRLKSAGSFSSEKAVNLSASAFVPANSRTRIALEIKEPFNWPPPADASSEVRFRQLVAQEVADLDGFALFDEAHRYQIDLPGSWPAVEPAQTSPRRP
jgi:hypothetical protein